MAGGQGTRLWPMSRKNKPKQLFNLISDQTLLRDTIDRLIPHFPLKNIYISTNQKYVSQAIKQIPKLPKSNIISEPSLRDTAASIGYTTTIIQKKDPNAIVAVLSSDHYIEKKEKFVDIIKAGGQLAERDNAIVILGINPTYPATELGYININKSSKSIDGQKVYTVKKFVEKPDIVTAKKYFKSWKYFWNAGIFIFPVNKMMSSFAQHLPDSYKILQSISTCLNQKSKQDFINKSYEKLDKISIDFGIMEKLSDLVVIPADIGWSDIGTWSSLKDVLCDTESENIIKGNIISLQTKNVLAYGNKKPIALFGVEDMIIVDTDDITLVCPKNKAIDIKKFIEYLKQNNLENYL